jgi:hypothetical protein
MFRRELHRALGTILDAIDPVALEARGFALGGATRIALGHGEVRESNDLDFLGSDTRGFAELRSAVRSQGYAALFRHTSGLELPREPRIDQYGIRFPVRVGERTLKVELVHEGRIALGPAVREPFCAVPCLSIDDSFTEKLLACSDRGDDATQLDRDIIDLSVLRAQHGAIPSSCWTAAERAYGTSVRSDLARSIQRFRSDASRRERAFRGLRVDDPEQVVRGIEAIATDLGLPAPEDD